MECRYCEQFHSSPARMETKQRFCSIEQRMVREYDEACDKFENASTFWCDNTDCWIDVKICTARQKRQSEECKKCTQQKSILEIRRFIGRQSLLRENVAIKSEEVQSKPRILIRR
jgi:hypothetical protein